MASQTITSRLPQQGDPVEVLLARLLASTSQRVTGTALALTTRNATTQSSVIDCTGFRGIIIFHRITAVPGVDTVAIVVRGFDPVSGIGFRLATGSAQSATGLFAMTVGPGFATPAALPDQIRIEVSHSPSPSGNFDYSVGYCLIP